MIEVPRTSEFEINVEDVLAALTPSTKLIVICSPNNPTGNLVAESDVLALLESGRIVETGTHQSLMIEGGPYSKLFETESVT